MPIKKPTLFEIIDASDLIEEDEISFALYQKWRLNNLGDHTLDAITEKFQSISEKLAVVIGEITPEWQPYRDYVTCLNLSRNKFWKKNEDELANIFRLIPLGIVSLDLSSNLYKNRRTVFDEQNFVDDLEFAGVTVQANFIRALSALPSHILYVDLRNNQLGLTEAEYAPNLAWLPATVKCVTLGNREIIHMDECPAIDEIRNARRAEQLLSHVSNWVNTKGNQELCLAITNSPFIIDESLLHYFINFLEKKNTPMALLSCGLLVSNLLLAQVDTLLQTTGSDRLRFHTIELPLEIDEVRLSYCINTLERINTPIALLTCGLLLEGRITTYSEEKDNLAEYMEKRIHDAISSYIKSAQCLPTQRVNALAEFLLWEIKVTSRLPSVQMRLSQLDLVPNSDYVSTFDNYKAPRAVVRRLLVNNEYGLFSKLTNKIKQQFEEENSNQEAQFLSCNI